MVGYEVIMSSELGEHCSYFSNELDMIRFLEPYIKKMQYFCILSIKINIMYDMVLFNKMVDEQKRLIYEETLEMDLADSPALRGEPPEK